VLVQVLWKVEALVEWAFELGPAYYQFAAADFAFGVREQNKNSIEIGYD
jgi:hypothetical protein